MADATVADFQETPQQSDLVTLPSEAPNMIKHDPATFAGLTADRTLQDLYGRNLIPNADDIKGVYNDALKSANDYHKSAALQQTQAQTDVLKQQALLASHTLAAEEAVKTAAAEQQKQWEQGPGAVAQAAAIQKAGGTGEIQALGGDDMAKLDAMTNGYEAVNNLGNYFNKMMEKPRLGVGGQIHSLGGHLQVLADATSPEALAFSRASDAAIVPIGRGVMGETGASPTKESMIELAKTITMPRIQDDDQTGNQGVFQLKQRIMQNLQSMRDNRYGRFDTTQIDRAIAKYNSDFMSPDVQKYNPLGTAANPLVNVGNSSQANAILNTRLNAGVQMPAQQQIQQPAQQQIQQPAGQAGAYQMPPNFSPPIPTPLEQGTQEDIAAVKGTAQKIGAAALGAAGFYHGAATNMAKGAGDVWNWLSNLQVHYPPRDTNPEYVGQ